MRRSDRSTFLRHIPFDQSTAIEEVSVYHSPRSSMRISDTGLSGIALSFSVSLRHATSETGSTSHDGGEE